MMNDDSFEKIDAWLSGDLPEAEARAFEAEITADATLAAEVERHRRGREALDRLAEQTLQTDIARWRESMDELPAPPVDANSTSGTTRWVIAGVLALLVFGALYWLWSSKDLQPNQAPAQDKLPIQIQPTVPIAITPPDEPVNENKDLKQTENDHSSQLIAMAETNLSDLKGAILQQYGQTMGEDDEENPFFTKGVKAFKGNELQAAKKNLLQVPKTDPYFPSSQEMLAFIYLREKNYPSAVQSYESFASQSSDPAADWYLLQFYLTDYQHYKTNFAKKLRALSAPENHHRYQKEAEILKLKLGRIGVK